MSRSSAFLALNGRSNCFLFLLGFWSSIVAKKAELRDITFYDHSVTLRLSAIGEEGNEITLEESGSFALPANGADKIYKLAEVKLGEDRKPEAVIVEYNLGDGVKTIEIKVPAQ